jgi:hypothetical protein
VAVFLLTALIFPVLYQVAIEYSPILRYSVWFLAGIAARNVLLVICTVWFMVNSGRGSAVQPAPGDDADRAQPPDRAKPAEPAPLPSLASRA